MQYFSLCKKRSDLTCDVTILTIEMTSNISTMFAGTVLVFLWVSHQRAVANPSCFVLFIYFLIRQNTVLRPKKLNFTGQTLLTYVLVTGYVNIIFCSQSRGAKTVKPACQYELNVALVAQSNAAGWCRGDIIFHFYIFPFFLNIIYIWDFCESYLYLIKLNNILANPYFIASHVFLLLL